MTKNSINQVRLQRSIDLGESSISQNDCHTILMKWVIFLQNCILKKFKNLIFGQKGKSHKFSNCVNQNRFKMAQIYSKMKILASKKFQLKNFSRGHSHFLFEKFELGTKKEGRDRLYENLLRKFSFLEKSYIRTKFFEILDCWPFLTVNSMNPVSLQSSIDVKTRAIVQNYCNTIIMKLVNLF